MTQAASKQEPMPVLQSLEELNQRAADGSLLGLFDVPIDLYHQGPGISSTGLKEILKSPAHFRAYMENDFDSDALRMGRLIHMAVLEPERFAAEVVVAPTDNKRTKAWKEFAEKNGDKIIIKPQEASDLDRLVNAVQENPVAHNLLGAGQTEITVYWTEPRTGILCKARADHIRNGFIFDLKSCQDARFKAFQRSVVNFKYHVSAAFYLDGFRTVFDDLRGFAWAAVEKTPPHGMGFYAADKETLDTGREEYLQALETYSHCKETDEWPCYEAEFVNLGLPFWYYDEDQT